MSEDAENKEKYMSKLKDIQEQLIDLYQNIPSEHHETTSNTQIIGVVTSIYDNFYSAYKEHHLKK